MPSNRSSRTLAVSDAAQAVGVTVHSLRRWCEWHAAHLSASANPAPGQARRLTGVDIEVLRHVKALRDEGLQTIAINVKLSSLTFAEIDTPIEDQPLTIADAPGNELQTTQDALDEASALTVALHAIATIQHDMETLKQSVNQDKRGQHDGVVMFGVGFIAALLFVLLIVGMAVLYGGFR